MSFKLSLEEKEFIDLLSEVGNNKNTCCSIDTFKQKIENNQGYSIFNWDVVEDIITHMNKPLCVISCAGSGKTTVLLYRLCYRLLNKQIDPSKTLVISFLKSDADKLKAQFSDMCRDMGIESALYNAIRFGTLHSVFLEMLRFTGVNWKIITESDRSKLIRTAAKGITILKSQEEVTELSSLFTLFNNSLLPVHEVINSTTIKLDVTPMDIINIFTKFTELKSSQQVMDFDDIQTYLYKGVMQNKSLVKYISRLYNAIYLDECQDLSSIQYEILKAYFQGEDKDLFAIGDDDQAIYSWRGGNIDIITRYLQADFGFVFKKLEYNYRCKSNIVDFVKNSIVKNRVRFEKNLKAYNDGGIVKVLYSKDRSYLDMAMCLEDEISKYTLKEINNTAILVRENKQALPLMLVLLKNKIDFIVTNDVMGLKADKAFNSVMDLIKMCANNRTLAECGGILKSILGWKSNKIQTVAEKILDLDRSDVELLAPALLPFYNIAVEYKNSKDFDKLVYDACTSFGTLIYSYNKAYGERIFYVANCIDFIKENFVEGNFALHTLNCAVNEVDEEIILRRNQKIGVTISTVHGSKGKGWSTVVVFPDVTGSFPPDSMCPVGIYEEERRLHYVACTRAKDRLIILTALNNEGDYLKECDNSFAEHITQE